MVLGKLRFYWYVYGLWIALTVVVVGLFSKFFDWSWWQISLYVLFSALFIVLFAFHREPMPYRYIIDTKTVQYLLSYGVPYEPKGWEVYFVTYTQWAEAQKKKREDFIQQWQKNRAKRGI